MKWSYLAGVAAAALLAGSALAADIDNAKLELAQKMGATSSINAKKDDLVSLVKKQTLDRGADVVIEAAGTAPGFRASVEAVRPGGEVIWLGKIDVQEGVAFRWGSLMQEKRIRRSSYGDARPSRDFPMLARAYLDGRLMLVELITRRIRLDGINDGFSALRSGQAIRSVVMFE